MPESDELEVFEGEWVIEPTPPEESSAPEPVPPEPEPQKPQQIAEPHLEIPEAPAPPLVGAQALSEALSKAGIDFPIERARLLALTKGVTVQYRPGETLELSQILGLAQNSRFYYEKEIQSFVQQTLTPAGWRPGQPVKPVFAEHYGR